MSGLIDPVAVTFYAFVCAVLAACVSAKMRWGVRLLIGGIVGVGAAVALPALRGSLGI